MKPVFTWIVAAGDGDTVGAIVCRMGASARDGRIFFNGRPASLDDAVEAGDRIEVYPRRDDRGGAIEIVAQRDGIVFVAKPAGLPSETTRQGESSIMSELITLLNGGKVHVASRLDVQVSGVVLCTLGRDAARRVVEWRERGQIERTYLAIACGRLAGEGEWSTPLGRARDRGGRHKSSRHGVDRRPARSRYRVLAQAESHALLELSPVTGRMHQLRAHAADAGAPLLGDRLYGGEPSLVDASGAVHAVDRIALHCARVALPDLSAVAPVPVELLALWRLAGGRDDDWSIA